MSKLVLVDIEEICHLFQFYASKGTFKIKEYADIHRIYLKFENIYVSKNESEINTLMLSELVYVKSMLKICTERYNTQIENFGKIFHLYSKIFNIIEQMEILNKKKSEQQNKTTEFQEENLDVQKM